MKKILLSIVVLVVAIQFTNPDKANPKVDDSLSLKSPKNVESVLKKSCYDCHSFETRWTAYADIAPLSWFIVSHVNDGRKALNFSEWSKIEKEIKVKRVKRIIQTTNNGMMPLSSYLSFHEEAELSSDDKKVLRDWANAQLSVLEK